VISRIVREMDGQEPRGGQVAKVFESLDSGSPASIGSLVARPERGGWTFSRPPKKRRS
jgi:tRNA(Ile)-lysidine synthase